MPETRKKEHAISQTADCESSLPWADSFPLHICFPEKERGRERERETPRFEKWASHASVFAYEIMRERQHLVSPTAARRRRRNRLAAAATSCMMMVMMMVQELQSLMDRVWRIIFTMDCVKILRPRPRPHLPLLRMEIVCMRRSSGWISFRAMGFGCMYLTCCKKKKKTEGRMDVWIPVHI